MSKKFEYAGNTYGGVTVLSRTAGGYEALCANGHTLIVPTWKLYRAATGSGQIKCAACRPFPEPCKQNPAWQRWSSMLKRARKRNIPVAKRWNTFANFFEDMGAPPKGKYIDRINNDGGYSKDNCRWVTPKQSTENRRNTVWVTYKGRRYRVIEIARLFRMPVMRVYSRLARGWSVVQIANTRRRMNGFYRDGTPLLSRKMRGTRSTL